MSESCTKDQVPLMINSCRKAIEFRRYMQGKFDHYYERRNFITQEMNALINYVEEFGVDVVPTIEYSKTGWEQIDLSLKELISSLESLPDRISINEIGVRCRETIILLSNEVYDESLHHPKDYPDSISPDDAKRKFDGYFDYIFPGSKNEEKRNYSKACNKLANYLTHAKSINELDAKLCINATISLIQMIKIIHVESLKK